MDKNIELQLENQGRLLVPFVLVALYWGIVASFGIGRIYLAGLMAIWAMSTILVAVARQRLEIGAGSMRERIVDQTQKVSVIFFTALMLPLFLLMNVAEKKRGEVALIVTDAERNGL